MSSKNKLALLFALALVAVGVLLTLEATKLGRPHGLQNRAPSAEPGSATKYGPSQDSPATTRKAVIANEPLTGEVVGLVLRKADRTPVAEANVHLTRMSPARSASRWSSPPVATTDAVGAFRFDALLPGPYRLRLDRNEVVEEIEVHAGAVTEMTLLLPDNLGVRGVVVDPAHNPVGGAAICLTTVNSRQAVPVTRTRADGTYQIECVSPRCQISVRAAGYAPTGMRAVTRGKRVEGYRAIDFVLHHVGGRVIGRVRDSDGRAIEAARVIAGVPGGVPGGFPGVNPDGISTRSPSPQERVAEADGSYQFDSVSVGWIHITAGAPGYAGESRTIAVQAGKTSTLDFRLLKSARVRGVVTGPGGAPIIGARVSARDDCRLVTGPWAESDREGRYSIEDVAPGMVELSTRPGPNETHLLAQTDSVQLEPGELVEWNPVLRGKQAIVGRAVDGDGDPLPGLWVHASPAGWTQTDEFGRFIFSACDARPNDLALIRNTHAFPQVPLAVARNVYPGDAEVVLVAKLEPSAFLVGRTVDGHGLPVGGVKLDTYHANASTEAESGAFELGPLPAGEYPIRKRTKGGDRFLLGTFAVEAGQRVDVGDLVIFEPGSLVARVEASDGLALEWLHAYVLPRDDPYGDNSGVSARWNGRGVVTASGLLPDDYYLVFQARGVAESRESFTVVPGQATTIDVVLRPGRPVRLRTLENKGAEPARKVFFEIQDQAGDPVGHRRLSRSEETWTVTTEFLLAPGEYQVRVHTDTGLFGIRSLTVPSNPAALDVFEIQVQ